VRDLQIITDELLAKDRQTMTTQIEMLKKIVARGQDKQAKMDLVCEGQGSILVAMLANEDPSLNSCFM